MPLNPNQQQPWQNMSCLSKNHSPDLRGNLTYIPLHILNATSEYIANTGSFPNEMFSSEPKTSKPSSHLSKIL